MNQIMIDENMVKKAFPENIYTHSILKTYCSYWVKLLKTIISDKQKHHSGACDFLFIGKTSHIRWCYSKNQNKFVHAEEYALPLQETLESDMITIISDGITGNPFIEHKTKSLYDDLTVYFHFDMLMNELKHYHPFSSIKNKYIPEFIRYAHLFYAVLYELNPKIVFVTGWMNILVCSYVCHSCNLDAKVIYYQEGLLDQRNIFFNDYLLLKKFYPDYFFVNSDIEKQYLIEKNIPSENIKLFGGYRYDFLAGVGFNDSEICLKYGIDDSKTTVMYVSQSHVLSKKEVTHICTSLFAFFSKHKKRFNFIVKIHPSETTSAVYDSFNMEYDCEAIIVNGRSSIFEVLSVSDVVLSSSSTVGSEAVLMDKIFFIFGDTIFRVQEYDDYGFPIIPFDNLSILLTKTPADFKCQYAEVYNQYRNDKFNYVGWGTQNIIDFCTKELMKK